MNTKDKLLELSNQVILGNQIALAKAITIIENEPELIFKIEEKYRNKLKDSRSHIVGFTGSPGAGKSTLTDAYVSRLRQVGKKVGIIAVDPSSPFTGGALLGDRIRMKRHFTDDNVFIRSMGSRGNVGGLNDSIFGVTLLYKLYGFDYIIIETVGAGQSEIDIVFVADTVILVLSPGSGDEIQLMKAGIMEIADVFVINKSDMEGADLLKLNLETTLSFSDTKKPIVMCIATSGKGIEELYNEIEKHRNYLAESGEIYKREERRRKKHAETILNRRVQKILSDGIPEGKSVSEIVEYILSKFCEAKNRY
ncbi:MAG: methylmalonyl Co-A mutase-associated GTPase MeaB [Fervidobacterium sp.]|nr:methylmalonyl Co-A mutase-associated GTPase MeaB [Fervidobacterium sp.]